MRGNGIVDDVVWRRRVECRKRLGWWATRRRKTARLISRRSKVFRISYTDHIGYLMFLRDRGLQPGAPLELRGIRLWTASKVPLRLYHASGASTTITVFPLVRINRSV
ncbi:hypothetical protein KCP78_03660 [Salmonella enterica subsp. enterica]|nr:hypothetical protein KCP78_03660 [Salmonella enterica subsp. enterica]